MSATTPFLAMGVLVNVLSDIITKAAAVKEIPVPQLQAPPPTQNLVRKFALACSSRGDPAWPFFLAVTAYISEVTA